MLPDAQLLGCHTVRMRRYGQFCPIAVGAEIFAERWTPLIVRELFAGSTRFNQLQRGLPRIPKAILARRLRYLEETGVVSRRDHAGGGTGYELTPAGRELAAVAVALGEWARQWGHAEIREQNLDPDFLLWDIHRDILVERLPELSVVVRIDLTGAHEQSYWLVLERPEPSLCLVDPGMEVDISVVADTVALHRVWVGELDFAKALTNGAIALDGPPELRRAFPGWLAMGFFTRQPATS
jgi:DNA-binding HxlR family transcriptional regulator